MNTRVVFVFCFAYQLCFQLLVLQCKIVLVGSLRVGKTTLGTTYCEGKYRPTEYVPTLFENMVLNVTISSPSSSSTMTVVRVELRVRKRSVAENLCLSDSQDTAAHEEYMRLRPLLSYPNTDVFLICCSVADLDSFLALKYDWLPEVEHHCPKALRFVVGTKTVQLLCCS